MRIESSVTSVSWIPSEAVRGILTKLPFDKGLATYDDPPPDALERGDLGLLKQQGRFRFANELRAWVHVDDGRIVGHGQEGGGHINTTTFRVASKELVFSPVGFHDLRPEPEVGDGWVRFVQTAGGRTGLPAPRRVRRPPFIQIDAPTAWTTLALTIHADGRSEHEVVGASPFPRHWIYDGDGKLVAKTGFIDFKTWYRGAFGHHTPWGNRDSKAVVSEVETALERQLSTVIMRGGKPILKKLDEGDTLVKQGDGGGHLFLLLDGVLEADVDGSTVAQYGPGAILGERAFLEGGRRTATLKAVTRCRVASVPADQIDRGALSELSGGHRKEHGQAS